MRTETEWRTWMFSVARRWTHCAADAEDLVQEVLLRFWVAFGVLPWKHEQPEWVQIVCRRWVRFRAAELSRSALVKCEVPIDDRIRGLPDDHCGSETSIVDHVAHQLLLQRLSDMLSFQQQKMLRLYLNGYTYQEIAEQMHICVGTVKRQFSRIHQKAQTVLSTFWGSESELRGGGVNADDDQPADENAGDRRGRLVNRYVWELELLDASGGDNPKTKSFLEGYNEVRISDGTHLIGNLRRQVAQNEEDIQGSRRVMREWMDMLRALQQRGYTFRRIRETE